MFLYTYIQPYQVLKNACRARREIPSKQAVRAAVHTRATPARTRLYFVPPHTLFPETLSYLLQHHCAISDFYYSCQRAETLRPESRVLKVVTKRYIWNSASQAVVVGV
jgi:hypothetical protein